ncbi:hypothetical protein D3C72_2431150 [compost metagenome]
MILMRFAALSMGPMILMYGLEAVCNKDKAAPWIKIPVKNKPKLLELAAGIKTREPTPNTIKPITNPFLNPSFLSIHEDGNAKKK